MMEKNETGQEIGYGQRAIMGRQENYRDSENLFFLSSVYFDTISDLE